MRHSNPGSRYILYNFIVIVLICGCFYYVKMVPIVTFSPRRRSIADDVDDLLAFSDPVPDPFSSNDIVGRGGVNQIE